MLGADYIHRFCAKLGPRGKRRSLQGLLESAKKIWDSHAFCEKRKEMIFLHRSP